MLISRPSRWGVLPIDGELLAYLPRPRERTLAITWLVSMPSREILHPPHVACLTGWLAKVREPPQLFRGQHPVKHGDAAHPAGEADTAAAVDDATDSEGAAAVGVLRCVEIMWIPPGIQPQGDEITRDLFAAAQDNFYLGKAMLSQFDAFVSLLTKHFYTQRFAFGWVVVLVFWEVGVFAVLLTGQLCIVALPFSDTWPQPLPGLLRPAKRAYCRCPRSTLAISLVSFCFKSVPSCQMPAIACTKPGVLVTVMVAVGSAAERADRKRSGARCFMRVAADRG